MQPSNDPDSMMRELNELRQFIEVHEDIKALLALSADHADRMEYEQQRSRAVAWRIAAGSSALTLLAFAVAAGAVHSALQPAPPPRILAVEKTTGIVQPLVSLAEYQITAEDATIRRCIATFLRARESYSGVDLAEQYYRDAGAFMSPQLQAQWAAYWDTANPQSPMRVYKDAKLRTEINAITLLRNGHGVVTGARASLTRTVTRNGAPEGAPTNWIATIAFHWVNAPTDERDRRVNDLGFEVTSYDVDPDIGAPPKPLPQPLPQAQQATAAPLASAAPAVATRGTP